MALSGGSKDQTLDQRLSNQAIEGKKKEFYENHKIRTCIVQFQCIKLWIVVMTNSYKIQNIHEWAFAQTNDSIFPKDERERLKMVFVSAFFLPCNRKMYERSLNFSVAQNKIKKKKWNRTKCKINDKLLPFLISLIKLEHAICDWTKKKEENRKE